MNVLETIAQQDFQRLVSEQYGKIADCSHLSDRTKGLVLDYLQVAGASSDEPVSIDERKYLADQSLREYNDVNAHDLLNVRRLGREVLNRVIRL